ncbi:MAG: hypothetical protein HKN95_03445 [Acidimicrobiia bacterium]|nr:hypothetical protein [Acidimicrobiia bacterium]
MTAWANDRGSTPIEFALAVGFLLIPMAVLVMSIAPWVERQSMARVAAGEAARVLVLSAGSTPDEATATSVALLIASNHGVDSSDVAVFFCAPSDATEAVKESSHCPDLVRGALVDVEVRVRVPAATVLGIGTFGEATVSARVTEQVELYRSFPP